MAAGGRCSSCASHALRERINAIIRERLVEDDTVRGSIMATEGLVCRSYTNAEKRLAAPTSRATWWPSTGPTSASFSCGV